MSIIAYSLSDNLNHKLEKLEELRKELHVAPIDRKRLLYYQWSIRTMRIKDALFQDELTTSLSEINKIIISSKVQSAKEKKIIGIKKAFDFIRYEWYVSSEKVTFEVLLKLNTYINGVNRNTSSNLMKRQFKDQFNQLFDYLNIGNEHPVIQAGICYSQILMNKDLELESKKIIATLHAYVFLYKYGYDFRELLNIEAEWIKNTDEHDYVLKTAQEYNNITTWLEYFTDVLISQTSQIVQKMNDSSNNPIFSTRLLSLNSRQREIIQMLEDPKSRITNKQVQKKFSVSQITASRDLAKLTIVGVLFSHGKGRSTWYSKT